MFRSRKSSVSQISPLEPPPQPQQPQQRRTSMQPTPPNSAPGQVPQGQGRPPRPPTQGARGPGSFDAYPPQPAFAGGPRMDRVQSHDQGSAKGEKRRSGFFGFGGKKKDKAEKGPKREDGDVSRGTVSGRWRSGRHNSMLMSLQKPRSSFSIDRESTQLASRPVPTSASQRFPQGQGQQIPQQHAQAQALRQQQQPPSQPRPFARDQGPTPPPQQQQRIPAAANDGQRSQSLEIPRNHQQAVNGQQRSSPLVPPETLQQSQTGMPAKQSVPRSVSMPMAPPAPGTTPNGGSGSPRRASLFSSGSTAQDPNARGSFEFGNINTEKFQAILELIALQPQKTYVTSPPELEMILARTSAGGQPKLGQPGSPSNDWDAVWLQLSGISLSMWSMKETRAAAAKGDKVPPTYFNITDSSLELLAPLPPPPHRPNSRPHNFVYSLNTAGSNRLLFSSPTERDLARWVSGLRLAAWERARLEEIYTGHLVQYGEREPPVEVGKGRSKMEGWVRVRVMGGTDWRRLWAVLSTPGEEGAKDEGKHRRRSFFGIGGKEEEPAPQEPNTGVSMAAFYTEPRTAKNKTSVTPVLTITNVSQAYAVFPEHLEVMVQSNLCKVVGRVSGDMVTIEGRLRDSGWALLMPETPGEGSDRGHGSSSSQGHGQSSGVSPLGNMMRWVTGFHDAFALYGRPEKYNWNPRDPKSLFFAYPQGPHRGNLFLTVDEALRGDFRVSSLAEVRAQLVHLVHRRLAGGIQEHIEEESGEDEEREREMPQQQGNFRLPPLAFNELHDNEEQNMPRSLTPITERTDVTRQNSTKTSKSGLTIAGMGSPPSGTTAQGDRKTSGGSSKHGSQSSKHSDFGIVPMSNDGFAPLTEEPGEVYSSNGSGSHSNTTITPQPPVNPLPGFGVLDRHDKQVTPSSVASKTSESVYSQETGLTPVAPSNASYYSAKPSADGHGPQQTNFPVPVPNGQSIALAPPVEAPTEQISSAPGPEDRPPLPPFASEGSSEVLSPTPRKVSSGEPLPHGVELAQEPAAMYLMNMVEEPPVPEPPQRIKSASPPTNGAHVNGNQLQRKPSGARALPVRQQSAEPKLHNIQDRPSDDSHARPEPEAQVPEAAPQSANPELGEANPELGEANPELGEDFSSYMNYADNPTPVKPKAAPAPTRPFPPKAVSPPQEQVKSSFAPSRAVRERRAKAEQDAKDQEMAKYKPGGGKRIVSTRSTMPEFESSDEDEDEDEEEEESENEAPAAQKKTSLPVPPGQVAPVQGGQLGLEGLPRERQTSMNARALPPVPVTANQAPDLRLPFEDFDARSRVGSQYSQHSQRSSGYDPRANQYMDRPRNVSRTPSPLNGPPGAGRHGSNYHGNGAAYPMSGPRQSYNVAPPPATRQSVWNANFSAQHGMEENTKFGKFVDLEEPSVHLTKAFAPHGLLQAGIQDKEERSAKKQEELARETGSSLIDVPSKPPPPQAGLLGAVAAHERDRKNAGGIGATLTDREREKRLAEEKQREFDRLQRQQMGQFGGDMYPQQGFGQQGYGYGMGNAMMNQMPMMGYPYQGGFNPYAQAQQQAMMAAQMAYQQTIMAMSQAGSQAGDLHERAQSAQSRHRQASGFSDDRSASPSASQMGGIPSLYGGYPQGGMGMGMNGMGMPMPMQMPQMPWMMPGGGMPSPGMWGMPGPAAQGSPN
ncbi:hypothetical protein L202_01107 [Cryptococcus amylolentus CBS 6039]|uniref:Skg3/CAF120-like PH-like domain-containing protein n=1 Tax=Cryptococcus amylolentus CBS 6039 TaxID=1295533 RepID=A0A1E3I4W4_9TREE|nr:hypothetical protein L202_01107 [Cryptococcus amylolentus CBS 6039]ODN82846.1 hypothetical protein L202_01107 [Cryptococcus amylolentus CBS 6039]